MTERPNTERVVLFVASAADIQPVRGKVACWRGHALDPHPELIERSRPPGPVDASDVSLVSGTVAARPTWSIA